MNPTRLRSWIRQYGSGGVLLCACLLGLHHLRMKRSVGLVSAIALCAFSGFWWHNHRQHQPVHNLITAKSAPARVWSARTSRLVDSLASDLRAGLQQYPNFYQRFLWHPYHATQKALDGKEWAQIAPSLTAQGFEINRSWGPRISGRCEIILSGLTYQPKSGPQHYLVIDFEVYPDVSRTDPTTMTLHLISVGIRAHFNQPLPAVVRQSPYPPGSVLNAFLKLPSTRKEFQNFILDTIELQYHPPSIMVHAVVMGDYYAPYRYQIVADYVRQSHDIEYSQRAVYDAFLFSAIRRVGHRYRPERVGRTGEFRLGR